jgi:hypothetical protein
MNPAITVQLNAGVNSIELFAGNTITPGANPHIDSMLITSTNAPVTTFPPAPPIGSALNTIQDPGFESVTAAQLETGTPSPWTFTAGPLLGSTMSAAGVAGNVGYFTSGNPHAPEGTQVAFVQGAGSSFSQSINFSAGTYSLTFQAAQRGVSGGETFNVLVDGQVVGSFRPSGTSYSTFTTGNFALSAGSHTIEFLGAGSAGSKETALIDNVRLNEVPGLFNQPQDPGFEKPSVGTGTYDSFQYQPSGSPWSFSQYAGVSGNGSGFTDGNPNAPDGAQVAFLQGPSSVSQAVTFTAGTYSVSFRAAQRGNYQYSSQTFQVQVDGTVVGTFTPPDTNYTAYNTASFTVTAGSHTITFVGTDPDGSDKDNTAFIDAVRVNRVLPAVLSDPGFETPSVGTGTYGAFQYQPTGTPWTYSALAGVAGNGSGFTSGNPNAPEGAQVAFLQGPSSVSQAVTLAAGTYSVSFSAAQRQNVQYSSQTFQVQVDGTVVGTFTPGSANYTAYNTASFTVTAGSHTITFVGLDPDGSDKDNTAFIDQVFLFG